MSERTPFARFQADLREMAERELAAADPVAAPASTPSRPRRRRRRAIGLGVVVAGLISSAAIATSLISTGDPVEPGATLRNGYRPGSTTRGIAVTAPDRAFDRPWAASIYDTPAGLRCIQAGQLRGNTLGVVTAGVFHRYGASANGACGPPSGRSFSTGQLFRTEPARYLVFGRARRGIATAELSLPGRPAAAKVGAGGAFLIVLADRPYGGALDVTYRDAAGRRVAG